MEDQQGVESTVTVSPGDTSEHNSEASSPTSLYWTAIDHVPRSEDNNVRVLPGTKVVTFTSDHIQVHQQKIGEGGQGVIYKASFLLNKPSSQELTTPRGQCAVKAFKGKLHESRFGQWPEELFISTDCHYICKFYGYFTYEDSFCLVMEKYDCSLRACIDKHMKKRSYNKGRPFRGPIAMGIIIELAIGMAYLHLLNILHRDLKADNVFVMNISEENDTPAAVFIGDIDVSPTVVGTGFWRAPEILKGLKDCRQLFNSGAITATSVYEDLKQALFTTKSDVYSFAMTCYEILTGRIPFDGIGWDDHDAVLSGERPKLPSNLNPQMKELLNKCWHHDPNARPSFAEIVSELKGFVEGNEVYDPIFSNDNVESLRVRNSSLENNFSELKQLIQVISDKYSQEDFVVWAVELGNAIEQFKAQFGSRSFAEQPVLPSSKGLSRIVLFDTIHFTWDMFFVTCPTSIPEWMQFGQLVNVIFIHKMREGYVVDNIEWPNKEDLEEIANWNSIWNAWEEEKQRRPQPSTLVNRHDVCHEIFMSKDGNGRKREEICDLCKQLPLYAPKSSTSTFSLYSMEKYPSLKSMFSWS